MPRMCFGVSGGVCKPNFVCFRRLPKGDGNLSSPLIAEWIRRATKFALTPTRVYHAPMSPWGEMCGSAATTVLPHITFHLSPDRSLASIVSVALSLGFEIRDLGSKTSSMNSDILYPVAVSDLSCHLLLRVSGCSDFPRHFREGRSHPTFLRRADHNMREGDCQRICAKHV